MSVLPPLAPKGGSDGPLIGKGWNKLKLGSTEMPGLWKVTGGHIKLARSKGKKAGADGGNPVFHGYDPQPFEFEGMQWTDAQREDLVTKLANVLPQPGSSQYKDPVSADHPSLKHYGFPIFVHVLGASMLEVIGPCQTKLKIFSHHWMQPKPNVVATKQPVKALRSTVTGSSSGAGNASAPSNPPPTTANPNICGPPQNFTPGQ